MKFHQSLAIAVTAVAMLTSAGCAVLRDQQSVGEYVDDSAITTAVKAKFVENKEVDAAAISVETMKGEVLLSGFAKSASEKMSAERLARTVKGVKGIKNTLQVRS